MEGLYTNTSSRGDFFANAFNRPVGRLNAAVAFFTDSERLEGLLALGWRIRLLVRLGFPTSPEALRRVLGREGMEVRYTDSQLFHPKLYLFVDDCAVVGSANLTQRALGLNQEVAVEVPFEDPRYAELTFLFSEWWDQVPPLTERHIQKYEDDFREASKLQERMSKRALGFGDIVITNIDRGAETGTKSEIWLEDYRRRYDEFHAEFRTLQRIYEGRGRRKREDVPLRIELDGFLGWQWDTHGGGDTHLRHPPVVGAALEARVDSAITEWFGADGTHFDVSMAPKQYPAIHARFGTPESIDSASYEEILQALLNVHAFADRYRHYSGGTKTQLETFREKNDLARVRRTFKYLLHSPRDPVERMGRCIYDWDYKLHEFGTSGVQELLGWCNGDDLPICNGRTLKAMRLLGFDVTVRN